jgi:hypothetical protein
LADALGQAAVHLAVDNQGIDPLADVHHDHVAEQTDDTSVWVNLDLTHMATVRIY